jgi:hypothetical protein
MWPCIARRNQWGQSVGKDHMIRGFHGPHCPIITRPRAIGLKDAQSQPGLSYWWLMPLASKGICTVRKKMEEEEELTITVN